MLRTPLVQGELETTTHDMNDDLRVRSFEAVLDRNRDVVGRDMRELLIRREIRFGQLRSLHREILVARDAKLVNWIGCAPKRRTIGHISSITDATRSTGEIFAAPTRSVATGDTTGACRSIVGTSTISSARIRPMSAGRRARGAGRRFHGRLRRPASHAS